MNSLTCLAVLALLVPLGAAVTSEEVITIKAAINGLIEENGIVNDNGRTNFPYIATLVRLSFHDCVGTCDGCVDTGNSDNAGLATIIDDLDTLFFEANTVGSSAISDLLSRADFYALAGIKAVEKAGELQRPCGRNCTPPQPSLTFRTGRVDADCSSPPSRTLPSAHDGLTATLNFFTAEFGFSHQETVALLGAHTLGRASGANSGFRGPWVARQDSLDNQYYIDLANANLNWGQIDVGSRRTGNRFQWNHEGERGVPMMLNSDMCLLKDIPVNADGSVTSCVYSSCSNSSTASKIHDYATNNAAWISDFSSVFQKMIDHTNAVLQDVTATRELKQLLRLLQLLSNE